MIAALRRLWRYLTTPERFAADADCSECNGLGFDAGGALCRCVHTT